MRARTAALIAARRLGRTPTRALGSAASGKKTGTGDDAKVTTTGGDALKPPIMPEEYECCGNDCGEDCVWFIYFEDQKRYRDALRDKRKR